jgi:hypothetical protein
VAGYACLHAQQARKRSHEKSSKYIFQNWCQDCSIRTVAADFVGSNRVIVNKRLLGVFSFSIPFAQFPGYAVPEPASSLEGKSEKAHRR